MNSIARMSESKSVVEFVKDIESRPCLYDSKSHEYANHAMKRETWASVANKWNCSVPECKDKWRKIRTAYSRSLKPKYRNNKIIPTRPYYLSSYLKFINPRLVPINSNIIKIKNEPNDENLNDSDEILDTQDNGDEMMLEEDCFSEEDDDYIVKDETEDSEGSINEKWQRSIMKKAKIGSKVVSLEDNIESIKHKAKKTIDVKEIKFRNNPVSPEDKEETVAIVNTMTGIQEVNFRNNNNRARAIQRCSYCTNIESRPRKMLLFSILPDIEALTEQQMRVFRRELIDLLDRCKYVVNCV